jgi:hypothetical protein
MNADNDMNESALSYSSGYAKLIEQHLGRKPELADGLSDAQIRAAEKILGFQLPVSVIF